MNTRLAFNAVDVGVHSGIEPVIAFDRCRECWVENDLIEDGPSAFQSEFLFRTSQYCRGAALCSRTRNGGNAQVGNACMLDQIEALIKTSSCLLASASG